jgi:phage/plasmid primase-like uncharacterized protein
MWVKEPPAREYLNVSFSLPQKEIDDPPLAISVVCAVHPETSQVYPQFLNKTAASLAGIEPYDQRATEKWFSSWLLEKSQNFQNITGQDISKSEIYSNIGDLKPLTPGAQKVFDQLIASVNSDRTAIKNEFYQDYPTAPISEDFGTGLEISGSESRYLDLNNISRRIKGAVRFETIKIPTDTNFLDVQYLTLAIDKNNLAYPLSDPTRKDSLDFANNLFSDLKNNFEKNTGQLIEGVHFPEATIASEKVFLNVPYENRQEAKSLGAKWDSERKSWYAPVGTNLNPLSKWVETKMDNSKMSDKIYLKVPYSEHKEAKALGAKWDLENKLWFVPNNVNHEPLVRWLPKNSEIVKNHSLTPVEEFKEKLVSHGFVLSALPILDGKIHRVKVEGGKAGSLDGAYCGYLDGKPNAWFKNHRNGNLEKWIYTGQTMSQKDKENLLIESEIKRSLREKETLKSQEKAIKYAESVINFNRVNEVIKSEEQDVYNHPYLMKKHIKASPGIFFEKNKENDINLLIPGYFLNDVDHNPTLRTIQTITPEGKKFFEAGCPKKGAVFVVEPEGKKNSLDFQYRTFIKDNLISKNGTKSEKMNLFVAEGYATAQTICLATGNPVICAFDSGNLIAAAEQVKKAYPEASLIFCADNDHSLKNNIGVEKAREAANKCGGIVIIPEFDLNQRNEGMTDFNDLYCSCDVEEVLNQIYNGMELAEKDLSSQVKLPELDKENNFEAPIRKAPLLKNELTQDFKNQQTGSLGL